MPAAAGRKKTTTKLKHKMKREKSVITTQLFLYKSIYHLAAVLTEIRKNE